MVNENLKNALIAAGLTAEELADIIQVEPKSVQRWLSGRPSYPRHRAAVARALDRPEHELFNADTTTGSYASIDAGARRPGHDVVSTHAYADQDDAPDPVELIASAREHVDVLDDTVGSVLAVPDIVQALIVKGRRTDPGSRARRRPRPPSPAAATPPHPPVPRAGEHRVPDRAARR